MVASGKDSQRLNALVARMVLVAIAVPIIVFILPAWHEFIGAAAADLTWLARSLLLFIFDPVEYAWKWLVFVVIGALALWKG